METKNPPPMMTEKIPTTKPPTRSSAVSHVSSQGASALIHERSMTLLHPDASNGMHRLPFQRRMTREFSFCADTVVWWVFGVFFFVVFLFCVFVPPFLTAPIALMGCAKNRT